MLILLITAIAVLAGCAAAQRMYRQQGMHEKLRCVFRTVIITDASAFTVIFFSRFFGGTGHFWHTGGYTARETFFAVAAAAACCAASIVVQTLIRRHNVYDCSARRKGYTILKAVGVCLFAVGTAIGAAAYFVHTQWNQVRPEQLVINMLSPTVGTEIGIYLTGFEFVLLTVGAVCVIAVFCFARFHLGEKKREKIVTLLAERGKSVIVLALAICVCAFSAWYAEHALQISMLYRAFFVQSGFIEDNYVDPKEVRITFPEKKRNVIYFYLESIENTYLSRELGGAGYADTNLMPDLSALAQEGVVFSDTAGKFGGPMQITGTSWSMASMVNQNLGVPMKSPKSSAAFSDVNRFMSGTYGLGDLLRDNGYVQELMIGSDARFGALDGLYTTHGQFKIFDYEYARNNGFIPQDYHVWWGFEDDKLYDFAKQEITALYKSGKPFNFTMENADTHMPDGYLPRGAAQPYDSPYANAIAYSSAKVTEFIRWIQAQPFYDDTTVVLIGDHLSMDTAFFELIDRNYRRTQFNLILNSADTLQNVDASRFRNRQYANFDMLPTVLAAMGCSIEGDRLALGTNLFSDRKTILEQYGTEYVDEQLGKASRFYNEILFDE